MIYTKNYKNDKYKSSVRSYFIVIYYLYILYNKKYLKSIYTYMEKKFKHYINFYLTINLIVY